MDSRASSPEKHDQGVTLVMESTRAGSPVAVESLPLETRCPPFPLRQYTGFWLSERMLSVGVPAVHARFTPRSSDVILATFPKSGTTWLKSLAFATRNRATHPPSSDHHPLRRSSPHDCVRFPEVEFVQARSVAEFSDELEALPSPRLLATHLPYSLLPERMRQMCRIVCMCLFTKKVAPTFGADGVEAFTLQEAFNLFCDGRCIHGPQWRHVLEYWEESMSKPDKVLLLRYEEMLLEPHSNLKKLAKFMGCEFSKEEEESGVVDAIADLCSIGTLKTIKVNKNQSGNLPIQNANFFRKGIAGDWCNHMTPEMARRLDKIVEDALQGCGFTFSDSASHFL